jgi:uncharacterized protein (DUF983 family)
MRQSAGSTITFADAGDGPAVFVIMIIGFIVVGLALWLEVNYSPALWVHLIMWIPLSTVLSLGAASRSQGTDDCAAVPQQGSRGAD